MISERNLIGHLYSRDFLTTTTEKYNRFKKAVNIGINKTSQTILNGLKYADNIAEFGLGDGLFISFPLTIPKIFSYLGMNYIDPVGIEKIAVGLLTIGLTTSHMSIGALIMKHSIERFDKRKSGYKLIP